MHTNESNEQRDALSSLLSHLVVAVSALLAGVVLGGWLAFETRHWEAFKSLVEGSAAVGVTLAVGLCVLALAVSVLASYRRVAGAG